MSCWPDILIRVRNHFLGVVCGLGPVIIPLPFLGSCLALGKMTLFDRLSMGATWAEKDVSFLYSNTLGKIHTISCLKVQTRVGAYYYVQFIIMPYFKKKKESLDYEGKTVGFSTKGMKKRTLDNRNVWGTFNFTLFLKGRR